MLCRLTCAVRSSEGLLQSVKLQSWGNFLYSSGRFSWTFMSADTWPPPNTLGDSVWRCRDIKIWKEILFHICLIFLLLSADLHWKLGLLSCNEMPMFRESHHDLRGQNEYTLTEEFLPFFSLIFCLSWTRESVISISTSTFAGEV